MVQSLSLPVPVPATSLCNIVMLCGTNATFQQASVMTLAGGWRRLLESISALAEPDVAELYGLEGDSNYFSDSLTLHGDW